MKLACVVQRYGPEITGGSEAHCREVAVRLGERHEVEVLTSCARDYLHWHNVYPAGSSADGRVHVRRFRVARPRNLPELADIAAHATDRRRRTTEDQQAWFRANGPEVPGLLAHLAAHAPTYDLVLFWTYRYFPSYFGLPLAEGRAVLVPTAEEDPVLDFPVLREFFRRPRGCVFLTEEERAYVGERAGGGLPPSVVVGTGLEPPRPAPPGALAGLELPDPFVLFLGRVDRNKGCDTLVRYVRRYAEEGGRPVTLVLAGPVHMPLPDHPRIRPLGFVSDEVRDALLDRARALVMPSPYESLSIALLEGWNRRRPALVNGRSSVLRGQVRRANGGLYYGTYREFAAALELLLDDPERAARLGAQGAAYVEREYRWPTVMTRLEQFLQSLPP